MTTFKTDKKTVAMAMLKQGIPHQKALSERANVSANTISAMMQGAGVGMGTLGKIPAQPIHACGGVGIFMPIHNV